MTNYGIKIDLLKLKGAFVRNIAGKASTKRCIIIPVDECDGLFLGEKGCYLSLSALEMREPRFADTHCVKVEVDRAKREQMTDEERQAIPIIGGLHAIEPKTTTMKVTEFLGEDALGGVNDLPF